MVRELVEKFAPGFVKSILPVNQLPQMSKAVGLGSWAAVGGVFAFFLVQVRELENFLLSFSLARSLASFLLRRSLAGHTLESKTLTTTVSFSPPSGPRVLLLQGFGLPSS